MHATTSLDRLANSFRKRRADLLSGLSESGEDGVLVHDRIAAASRQPANRQTQEVREVHKKPTDLVFPTQRGHKDTRQNVRTRLLVKAIKKANEKLIVAGIEPIPLISPHGLRRTYASLRCVCGDDPVYVASQLGHTDPSFTLRVHAQAVKHRSKLTPAEREAFDEAVIWAQLGADAPLDDFGAILSEVGTAQEQPGGSSDSNRP